MAGRTRLYQQAKSPLIQGQSKYERPAWQPWLAATVAGGVIAAPLGIALAALIRGQQALLAAPESLAVPSAMMMIVSIPIAGVGAGLAVWLSNRMGWRRRFLGSMVFAVVLAAGAVATLAFLDIEIGSLL